MSQPPYFMTEIVSTLEIKAGNDYPLHIQSSFYWKKKKNPFSDSMPFAYVQF